MLRLLAAALLYPILSLAQSSKSEAPILELRIYHHSTEEQGRRLDAYLASCVLPALHRQGLKHVGVFHALSNDTARTRQTYLLAAYASLRKLMDVEAKVMADIVYLQDAQPYLDTLPAQPPYLRKETVLMRSFRLFPQLRPPSLQGPKEQRIYELRSYESLHERLYWNKVEMFNEGGEIALFDRLGFHAAFYGEVVAGARMPNLMYMTCFENRADREAHWQAFREDPEWKKLSVDPRYRKNVSRNETIFLRPAPYSDY